MGYTHNIENDDKRLQINKDAIIGMRVREMRNHPNYLLPTPIQGETQIAFALRCASHLVSPPQESGESYELECVDVRDGILSLLDDVQNRWDKFIEAGIAIKKD